MHLISVMQTVLERLSISKDNVTASRNLSWMTDRLCDKSSWDVVCVGDF